MDDKNIAVNLIRHVYHYVQFEKLPIMQNNNW